MAATARKTVGIGHLAPACKDDHTRSQANKPFDKVAFFEKIAIPPKGIVKTPVFIDIKGAPYEQAIQNIASRGMMNGIGDNRFSPETGTTRAQFFTMLYRMSKDKTHAKAVPFADAKAAGTKRPPPGQRPKALPRATKTAASAATA